MLNKGTVIISSSYIHQSITYCWFNRAKEFVDCIDHIRFLSWILIGSLTHSALTRNRGTVISYPIPINCGNYIGEHIFYILNGFAEHSKTSAIHMSSLFHSFILCQVKILFVNILAFLLLFDCCIWSSYQVMDNV